MSKPEDNDKIVSRVTEVDQFFGGALGPRYIAFEYNEENARWDVFSNAPTPQAVLGVLKTMLRRFEAEQVPTYGIVMNEGKPATGEAVPYNELVATTPADGKAQ